MLVQNLSNTFPSWCSNKSFRMHFTSSGQAEERRVLGTTRNLSSSAPNLPPHLKERKLLPEEIKTQRMGRGGGEDEQRDKGERERERENWG